MYYTLIILELGQWNVQFGSFDKSEVKEELQCWIDSYETPRSHCLIIATAEDQSAIDKAVNKLNESI